MTEPIEAGPPCAPSSSEILAEIQETRMFDIDDLNTSIRSKISAHKQLSPAWFAQRKQRITGSKLSQFLFMDGLSDMNKLHEEIFEGRPRNRHRHHL